MWPFKKKAEVNTKEDRCSRVAELEKAYRDFKDGDIKQQLNDTNKATRLNYEAIKIINERIEAMPKEVSLEEMPKLCREIKELEKQRTRLFDTNSNLYIDSYEVRRNYGCIVKILYDAIPVSNTWIRIEDCGIAKGDSLGIAREYVVAAKWVYGMPDLKKHSEDRERPDFWYDKSIEKWDSRGNKY